MVGLITSYYICLGKYGDGSTCLMLIPSKDWVRNGIDPISCNKWYCTSQDHNNKYKASWGQVVIVQRLFKGEWQRYYMRAKVPEWDKEDIRAMDIEEKLASKTDTPMDIYDKMERLVPTTDELVLPAKNGLNDSVKLRSKEDLACPLAWLPAVC